MPLLRDFISWLSTKPLLTRPIARTGMRLGFARRFIAGETLDEALRVAADLNAKGMLVIMNQLGENVTERREAEVADAASFHNFVEIDMEHSAVSGATVDLFEEVRSGHENVGLAVQAYLRRTEEDLRRLRRHRPKIRLVKGAYLEPPEVAFPEKRQVDENYAKLMRMLFREAFAPAIATHDVALLDLAKELARECRLAPDAWEAQMLLGVRRDLQEQLVREGYRVRVYVTFGTQWVPYFMRRLAERPANVAFVLRSLVQGK